MDTLVMKRISVCTKRFATPTFVACALLLAGCQTTQESRSYNSSSSSSSSLSTSSFSSSSSSFSSKGPVQMESENGHHYFLILSTGTNKAAENTLAREDGSWVLPTDLTSTLTPHLYAVVRGPFHTEEEAKQAGAGLRPTFLTGGYVKDAGALKIPTTFATDAQTVPASVLIAMTGWLSDPAGVTFTVSQEETGGTLCAPIGPALRVSAMRGRTQIREEMTAKQIALLKKFFGEETLSQDEQTTGVFFWVSKESGEVVAPSICLD